jgi:uncharacterized membrane protein
MGDVLLIVHILAAATWLGAGVTVGFLTQRLRQAGDETGRAFMSAYERMGLVVFNPAGVLVLLSGVLLVIDGPWEFEDAFVVIGILAVLTGAVFGARVFAPLSREAQAAHANHDRAELDRIYRRFRTFGIIDSTLIVLTIVAMVIKLGV